MTEPHGTLPMAAEEAWDPSALEWYFGVTALLASAVAVLPWGSWRSAEDFRLLRVFLVAAASWTALMSTPCVVLLARPAPAGWVLAAGLLFAKAATGSAFAMWAVSRSGGYATVPLVWLAVMALAYAGMTAGCFGTLFRARNAFGVAAREGWRVLVRRAWWVLIPTAVLEMGVILSLDAATR